MLKWEWISIKQFERRIENVMDHIELRRGDSEIDLENGGITSEEDGEGKYENLSSRNSYEGLSSSWSEFSGQESVDESANSEGCCSSSKKLLSSDEIFSKNWENKPDGFVEEVTNVVDKKIVREKLKKPKSKWPPKPPRPPGGPSLHQSDMKLIKEISELAVLKRKRTERRKALEKTRKEKPSSKNSSLIAMFITVLFLFVIIFQGLLGSHM